MFCFLPPLSASLLQNLSPGGGVAACPCCRRNIHRRSWIDNWILVLGSASKDQRQAAWTSFGTRNVGYQRYSHSSEVTTPPSTTFQKEQKSDRDEATRLGEYRRSEKEILDNDSVEEDTVSQDDGEKPPEIPSNILAYVVAPFLSDRETFNNFSVISKEVNEMCKEIIDIPWPVTMIRVGRPLWSLAYSPDGKILAAGSGDGKIHLWHQRRGPLPPLAAHLGRVYSIVFAPDGKTMVTGSGDGDVRVWNMEAVLRNDEDEVKCRRLNINSPHIDCLAFSLDGSILASCGDGTIRLWDMQTRQCMHILTEENRVVESVAFSPDGRYMATGTWGASIRFWDLASLECLFSLQESSSVHSIVYSPDGKYMACGSDKRVVRLWNVAKRDYVSLTGHTDSVWSVAYSSDGNHIASASDDGTVRVWSASSGKCKAISTTHGEASVYSVVFSPDSRMVASASGDGNIEIRRVG